ncbi:Phage minor capsid protein 2 [[Eubacterium] contortum]|uniref:Phage minor capsid protein 2 n=1 Tax=Faecalicatena contorta TaxID=39482 RepID=A0A174L914_9FIRM|nr:phage minor capsid protein [Faecalicatena contorta]CUP20603.1 Phage minor capsid protein 2 [[Eubacterium] contortum] [Faecalicatena contorta]
MTQGELEKIPLPFEKCMSDLEMRIMSEIVRAIRINSLSTSTSDAQIQKLIQMGKSEENIRKYVKEALDVTDNDLDKIFSDDVYEFYYGYRRAYKDLNEVQKPIEENIELMELIQSIREQTAESFRNMTGSMGFAIKNPSTGKIMYSPLMEFYQDTMDAAAIDIQTGMVSYDKALSRSINTMTISGVRWIDYASGWHNRVDVAARRAVMTGFRQIQGKINEQVAKELGTDSYEVSYHVGARPEHQIWQGRVWTYEQLRTVCGLGTVTGLHGANCYHDYNAFIPGVSARTYTDDQLEEMAAKENEPKLYNGKEYTTYEALQEQRKQETSMRKTRQDIKLLKEGKAGSDTITAKRAKYQVQMKQYKHFSKKLGLPEQMERVYQDGLGRA